MRRRYMLEDTSLIFDTHFAGKRRDGDKYPVNGRSFNVIIPDADLAAEMVEDNFDVRKTKPREGYEGDFEPEYYVKCQLKYVSEGGYSDPQVYLVKDGPDGEYPVPLSKDTVGNLDDIRLRRGSVCVTLSPYTKGGGEHNTLYTQVLYVKQDMEDDPWAKRYQRRDLYDEDS